MSNNNDSNNNGSHNDIFKALAYLSQIGITIFVCVALGLFIGWLLDRWLGTSPWLLIVFILLGIAAAIKSIVDFAKRM